MSSELSTIAELVAHIRSRAAVEQDDERPALAALFFDAIHETIRELSLSSSNDDFKDLTVLNFILKGADEGYSKSELKVFIAQLKSDN